VTTSAHDLDDVRTTIEETRADLAGTTAALAAKTDVKARVKAATATAATHVKDSTTGMTRRVVAVVAAKAGPSGEQRRQRAIAAKPARAESRGTRLEVWRARRAADPNRPRLADRAKAWIRERKRRRRGDLRLEAGPPATGRLGDGW
jgi:hypothetical protein